MDPCTISKVLLRHPKPLPLGAHSESEKPKILPAHNEPYSRRDADGSTAYEYLSIGVRRDHQRTALLRIV